MPFLISLNFNPTQLETLNRCRLYLQVFTLSDITSADGTTLIHHILQEEQLTDRKSCLSWPTQQHTQWADWILWSTALEHLQENKSLWTPLKEWISPSHQSWFWYMDLSIYSLFYNPSTDTWLFTDPIHQPESNNRCKTLSKSKFVYSKEELQHIATPGLQNLLPVSMPILQSSNELIPNVSHF